MCLLAMRFPTRAYNDSLLFLSSFTPLFLALSFRFTGTPLRICCLVLSAVGAGALAMILGYWRRRSAVTVVIASFDDRGADVGGYVSAYLLPLLVVPEPTAGDLAAYVLILFVIGLVYVRSKMIQLNPLLYLVGQRLYAVTTVDGFRGYLIQGQEPTLGTEVRVARRDNILLAVADH